MGFYGVGCSYWQLEQGFSMTLVKEKFKTTGQPVDVVKGPFKGKGEALTQWAGEAQTRLNQLYRDMANLRDETKTVPDRRFSVDLYSLSHRRSKSLRWRMNDGTHMTWERIVPLLNNMPPSMVWWHHEMHERMVFLNAQEKVARYQLKVAEQLSVTTRALRAQRP